MALGQWVGLVCPPTAFENYQIIMIGNLRLAVMLPEGEDLNEWVAVNTVDFFNQINMLYGTITEFCTEQSCPVMSAGPKYEVDILHTKYHPVFFTIISTIGLMATK